MELTLTDEPELREYQAAKLLDCSPRTIQRKLAVREFPPPDNYEMHGKLKIGYWKLSTLRKYKASRKIEA